MSNYKPYPAYKDSGIELIGDVPEHWQHSKVAWDMKMTIGWTPPTGNRSYYGGPHNWVSIADLSAGRVCNTKQTITDAAVAEMRGTQAPAGSLLFSYKLSLGEVALLEQPAYTNEAIAAFHPCTRVHMPFWKYAAPVILPRYSRENIYGSELLNQELMNSARMYLPDAIEQENIALALDRETARIDALITKKTRFIELLKEKRQALITHAVTKGLDPSVKMKDSGVEWIGDIPEHWQPMKFNRIACVTEGLVDPKVMPYYEMILLAPNHIESRTGKILSLETAAEQNAESGKYTCKRGAVVYSKIRPALAKVTIAPCDCLCSADMYPMNCTDFTEPEWLFYLMLSLPFTAWAVLESDRVAMPKINRESLAALAVFVPPKQEQQAQVQWLGSHLARIDFLAEKTQRSIDLLKEHRAALITAAVTGQIDLRESA